MATVNEVQDQSQGMTLSGELQRFGRLPEWLLAMSKPERVRAALAHSIPEFASGALTLQDCDVKRVRQKKDRWTAMYQLTVAELPQVVKLRGTLIPPGQAEPAHASTTGLGGEGWRFYLPELRLYLETQPEDEALPSLPRLTDPVAARELLEESIRAGSPAYSDIQIQACTPKVMRYKPGSRCTILYRLEYATSQAVSHGWPDIVVAKTYQGDKGQIAYDGMRALWDSAMARSRKVTIAEPLAFVPELNVLVQGPIREEQTLKELIHSALRAGTAPAIDELNHYMRMTAVGLAEMHRCDIGIGELRTWDDELAEVREVDARLAAIIPELGSAAQPLLARLEAAAADNPADPPVPTHGTFRPAQVLIHKGQIGFIDFDGFCQAEPALDLALFLGKIRDIGLSAFKDDDDEEDEDDVPIDREALLERLAETEAICEVFLAEYERHMPVSRMRIALWEALDLFTLVQHCWTKVKPGRLNTTMLLLERHLQVSGWLSA